MTTFIRATLISFLFLSISYVALAEKNPEDYWSDDVLEVDKVVQLFSSENCSQDFKLFKACYLATEHLAQEFGQDLVLNGKVIQLDKLLEVKEAKSLSALAAYKKDQEEKLSKNRTIEEAFKVNRDALFSMMILELLDNKKIEKQRVYYLASVVNKYLSIAIDPHAYIVPKEQFDAEKDASGQSFSGIGANISTIGGQVIISPISGGPAERAGIQEMDILISVNGESMEDKDSSYVASKIRGPRGESVQLVLQRAGVKIELSVERDDIEVKNLTSEQLKFGNLKIAYIDLNSFYYLAAASDIEKAILDAHFAGAQAIILDLRGNGGGFMNQVMQIAGQFLGEGVVALQVRDFSSETMTPKITSRKKITDLPMVTLIDAHSASASEILAGALQDHKRSWILGERSYGKGTVQAPYMFGDQKNVMLFRTNQVFYQPSGRTNQLNSIIPDFEVPIKPNATEEERFSLREIDMYDNVIVAESTPWIQPRADEVNKLTICMQKNGRAEKIYSKATSLDHRDYQLQSAVDLISCAL